MPSRKQDGDENVVPIRVSPMKGRKQNAAQKAAFERGRATRDANLEKRRKAREAGVPTRSSLLFKGDLTVKDLDDEELSRMRCRDRAGGFAGRAPDLPAHLARQMQRENINRALRKLDEALIKSSETLVALMEDEDVKPEVRAKIALALQDRVIGKVPDKLLTGEGTWDETFEDIILKVKRDREETA